MTENITLPQFRWLAVIGTCFEMSDNTINHKGENKMKRYGVFVIVVFVLVRLSCDFSATTEIYSGKNSQ